MYTQICRHGVPPYSHRLPQVRAGGCCCSPQPPQLQLPDVDSVQQHNACAGVVEALQQTDDCAFPAPAAAHERQGLTCRPAQQASTGGSEDIISAQQRLQAANNPLPCLQHLLLRGRQAAWLLTVAALTCRDVEIYAIQDLDP